jgi:hypothetical protein
MWSVKYSGLVFMAVLGIIQLAAFKNNYRGLFFFPARIYSLVFAVITIGSALYLFFTWNELHQIIAIEGSQQTGSFVISTALAIIFTVVCSSLLNIRRFNRGKPRQGGLDGLRDATVFQAIFSRRKDQG